MYISYELPVCYSRLSVSVTHMYSYVILMYPNVWVCISELLVMLPCVYPYGVLVKILGSAAVKHAIWGI